ncbi:hypothetical protein PVL29_002400 [Vitis rotundifolia]|uniref:Uncharacterized protein n=1 Tax=Vitis rotundifolia TaxID=103349 RepID=A0AA39AHZ6_VITRO|nr:hypothetical protein PVL29_002400 [Vitis rotundifolia]
MPPSAPSVKGSGFTNLDNVVADSTGTKFNEPSEDGIYKKDQGSLDVIQTNYHSSHNSAADKPYSEKTSPKAIGNSIPFVVYIYIYICYGGFCTLFLSHETFFMQVGIISNANGTLEKIEPVKLPNGSGGENFQVGSIHKGSANGWQHEIQEGAADWDEDWDKFEEEGMLLYSPMDNHNLIFVKELTLDVQNAIAPPKPKSMLVDKEKASTAETPTTASSSVDVNSEDPPSMG